MRAGSEGAVGTTPIKLPSTLDAHSYSDGERAYRRLGTTDPQRAALREKLIHYLIAEAARGDPTSVTSASATPPPCSTRRSTAS